MSDKSCRECRHLQYIEDETDGFILDAGYLCEARAGVSNLNQFPFRHTKCQEHSQDSNRNEE